MVVASQPHQLPQVSVVQPRASFSPPGTLIFAIVLTLVLGLQLFIPGLFCILPGVILAIVVGSLEIGNLFMHLLCYTCIFVCLFALGLCEE